MADALTGTLLTRVGLPGLMPLPCPQIGMIFLYALVSCLGVNDELKVEMIVDAAMVTANKSAKVEFAAKVAPVIG